MARILDLGFYAEHFETLLRLVFAAGIAFLLASIFIGAGSEIIVGDAIEYFEYARAVAVEGRLPTHHIKYPLGVSLVAFITYWPSVLLGKLFVLVGAVPPTSRLATGWSMWQQLAFCIPSLVLAFIAVRANVGMMVRLGFSARIVKPMVLFWLIATNIGFHIFRVPFTSETLTYSTLSLFYWMLVKWFYQTPSERAEPTAVSRAEWASRAAVAGLMLGLAGAVRQQNILHCFAVPLLLWTQRSWLFGSSRSSQMGESLRILSVVAITSAVLFVLPWIAWYITDGKLTLFSYGDEHFNWLSPKPLDALFHPGYHGLFVWHPAFAAATVGLVLFIRKHRDLAATWMVPILIQYYLISAWFWLSYGASIGHRGFLPVFPLLLAGWVAACDWLDRRGFSGQAVAVALLLTIANGVVTAMLLTGVLDPLGLPPTP
jgi:hypothetical protein